jgi:twinkle protein
MQGTEKSSGHGPCEKCGSSDGRFTYDDGHTHCFVCKDHDNKQEPLPEGLVPTVVRDLPRRKLRADSCRRYGYGVHEGTQVANYKDDRGRVVAQKIRRKDKTFTILGDAKKMRLYGQHLSKPGGRNLVITEGEIDCVTMSQVQGNKWPCVSVPNGAQGAAEAVRRQLTWVESFDRVVICMDQDEAGQAAALEIAEILPPGKAAIMSFNGKDPNELLQQGRSAELVQAFWEAKPYRPDGIMSWEELWREVADAPPVPSVPWPLKGLEALTDGIQEGSLVTIAAGPASGKSTFVHELVHHFAALGHRTGFISLEQTRRETVLGLLTPLAGAPLHRRRDLSLHDHDGASAKLNGMVSIYKHCGKLDAESLEATARFMAKGDGCSHIILDNLSVVVGSSGMSHGMTQIIDDLLNRFVSLSKETGATIILVVHLKRPGQGKGYAEGRPVVLEDMRGSGMLEAMSYTVVALERNQTGPDPTLALFRLLKCRHTGEAGVAGYMRYSRETGRLQECGAPEECETTAVDDF